MRNVQPDGNDTAVLIRSEAESELAVATAPTLPAGKVARLSPALKAFAIAMRGLDRIAPRLTTELMFRHFVRPRRRRTCDYRDCLPAGAERLAIDYRDHSLTAWCWGKKGPAVLLVHGWEDHSGAMLSLVEPLRQHGYRVVALDAPGHGLSPDLDTHLLDTGEALAALMRQIGRFQAIIAHSYGAAATATLLARQPQWMPDHLTLVSPMQDIRQHLAIFAGIAGLSLAGWNRLQHRVREALGQPLDDISTLGAAEHLNTPGLIVHDREDPLIPYAISARVAERWRDAELLATQGLGHRRTLGCPDVVGEILARMDACLRPSQAQQRSVSRSPA
ncbi:MAG: alpha/beta fold hydrolase [Wenzhouxiangella sp.]|jgi:pimeloyl-ACP methyl ester carboxylesterase|nr:alpha/beta fold hydrolase [Wenzhouxiangella sp.]